MLKPHVTMRPMLIHRTCFDFFPQFQYSTGPDFTNKVKSTLSTESIIVLKSYKRETVRFHKTTFAQLRQYEYVWVITRVLFIWRYIGS